MDNMRYKRLIIDRCLDLINSGKELSDCNNYDLAKNKFKRIYPYGKEESVWLQAKCS